MIVRISFLFTLMVLLLVSIGGVKAQIYDSDSLSIEIKAKNHFLVKEEKDLDIEVVYLSKSKNKPNQVYEKLEDAESSFGNCYFKLSKYDSVLEGYKDITLDVIKGKHPPKDFNSEEEILKYDLQKDPLYYGQSRALLFNVSHFIFDLERGKYSLKIYLRVGDVYGYSRKGDIVANSILHVESSIMNFEVLQPIHWRIPIR